VPIGRSERRKIVDRGSVNLLVLLEPPIIPASLVEIDLVGLLDFGKNRQDRIVVIHDLACPKDLAVSRTMSITDQLYLESETRCPTHRRINAALRDEAADNECLDRELLKALYMMGTPLVLARSIRVRILPSTMSLLRSGLLKRKNAICPSITRRALSTGMLCLSDLLHLWSQVERGPVAAHRDLRERLPAVSRRSKISIF
jgi:hypothetical protein